MQSLPVYTPLPLVDIAAGWMAWTLLTQKLVSARMSNSQHSKLTGVPTERLSGYLRILRPREGRRVACLCSATKQPGCVERTRLLSNLNRRTRQSSKCPL